jgi:hypothetical protein
MLGTGQTAAFAAAGLFAALTVSAPLAAAANSSSSAGAYSVAATPGAKCTIHPEGVTNDASRSAAVVASDDGKVRFNVARAAAAAWGTRLAVDCVLSNASQSQVVDLNDSSTFRTESPADLQPVKTGVRPPLTGDPAALSMDKLAQGHYPMRPDVSSPLYTKWLQQVTKPVDIYSAVPVTMLGAHNTGAYKGDWYTLDENWSGFVQAAGGFNIGSDSFPYVQPVLSASDVYEGYEALATAPDPQGCGSGQTCDDSSFWAGTGGAWVGSSASSFSPALLQNGFAFEFGGILQLFDEYYPGPVCQFTPPMTLNSNDLILFEGFDGDASCNPTTSTTPANGCFEWEDLTQGWTLNHSMAFPSGATWWPASVEYISEWHPGAGTNDTVTGETMIGTAMDLNGVWHADPGASGATDPYVWFVGMDNSYRFCAFGEWANGTFDTPEDPMSWTTIGCGPN